MRRAREERTSRVKEAREVSGSWEAANRYLSKKNVISISFFFAFWCLCVFYILYFCIFRYPGTAVSDCIVFNFIVSKIVIKVITISSEASRNDLSTVSDFIFFHLGQQDCQVL